LGLDERGYVVVNGAQETSVENVFAVGDVANPLAPTISGAVGAGATAAKVIAARLKG
jgi:thioredoxin reductase